MATLAYDDVDHDKTLKIDTAKALSTIGYNSLQNSNNASSSDDEAPEAQDIPPEDVRSAIGVSISPEQTRLTSPRTPAAEKSAAIGNQGDFFGSFDRTQDIQEEDGGSEDETDSVRYQVERSISNGVVEQAQTSGLPSRQDQASPRRIEPSIQRSGDARPKPGLFEGVLSRKRATSVADPTNGSWQKSLLSSLPSLSVFPRPFSLSLPFSSSHETDRMSKGDSSQLTNKTPVQSRRRPQSAGRVSELRHAPGSPTATASSGDRRRPSRQATDSEARLLRRSTSDHSLLTQRSLSRVETLGDDSRFQDVTAQENNRFKAIRDSLQDANIGLPSLKVANLTPSFLRERGASFGKQSIRRLSPDSRHNVGSNISDSRNAPGTSGPSNKGPGAGLSHANATTHPHFERALTQLEGDVVVLGGYRGSILRSAEPPHRQVWVPVKVGLNIRKVNLEVGFDADGDERASDSVIPGGMLSHIGPVDISRRLFKRMRACENARMGRLNVWDYGYDWRLSPHYLSKQLIRYLEKLPCNQPNISADKRGATVIAHSLGGLITRHAVNERPELFRGVVYAGVPHTCVNILGPLRHGDEVLLSTRVLTAQVNFSIRTSFALLPLDGRCFFDINTNEEYPVDFFDPQTWVDYHLSPCVSRPLPPLQPPTKAAGISGYVSSVANALPSLPLRGRKDNAKLNDLSNAAAAGGAAAPKMDTDSTTEMNDSARTAVTITQDKAMEYLERTLGEVKRFKEELAFIPEHADTNAYPSIAIIYGKSTPTVYGAKVNGRDGIKRSDAYDNLAFASGDGVVLAKSAMAPKGYTLARGGIVASDRGHVTLLGDLEALGKCLNAIIKSRRKGVGCGKPV